MGKKRQKLHSNCLKQQLYSARLLLYSREVKLRGYCDASHKGCYGYFELSVDFRVGLESRRRIIVDMPAGDVVISVPETPIIAPTIPPSPDYTPASPDYSPASDSESDPSEDPSSDHIPPLPAISPFLSSDDDTTDSDTPASPTIESSSEASSDFHSDASILILIRDTQCQIILTIITGFDTKRLRGLRILLSGQMKRLDECIAYVTLLGIDGFMHRVVVEAIDMPEPAGGSIEAYYKTLGDCFRRCHDHTQAIPVQRILALREVRCEQGTEGVDSSLTWWNSHKRTLGVEAANAMNGRQVERFIRVYIGTTFKELIVAKSSQLQDVIIRIANHLMNKKSQGYAAKSAGKEEDVE
ncbi:hypothetical protein Tco_0276514 [Tanacetum coccineum]